MGGGGRMKYDREVSYSFEHGGRMRLVVRVDFAEEEIDWRAVLVNEQASARGRGLESVDSGIPLNQRSRAPS